jgi:hypothetical protein
VICRLSGDKVTAMARSATPPLWTGRISGPDRMTDFELGLVAGILKGEGCFFVTTRRTAKYGPYVYARSPFA